jgi:G6PDH family F420-dependent oxidoreductase
MESSPTIGLALSSEEHPGPELVDIAVGAEQAGFAFAMLSDHYLPWTTAQGESPFAWSVLGAIANATSKLRLGTGVTCPLLRYHPTLVAQAAATVATLAERRFWLGLGTGERLNEHVIGVRWPPADVRLEMLEEAVEVIRALWSGDEVDHRGAYFTVENARLFSRPSEPVPILIAASGPQAARVAGRLGDGLVSTAPDAQLVDGYRAGGRAPSGPRVGQVTVCWAEDEAEARATALRVWPNAAIHGAASQELSRPEDFEALAKGVTPDQVAELVVCGPDPAPYRRAIDEFAAAGYDHVYLHQVGKDQRGFIEFAARNLL